MKVAALCLLLAVLPGRADAQDGGIDVRRVKVAVIYRDGTPVEVEGGCHISGPDCLAKAKEKADCCARAERLEKGHLSPPWLVIAGTVVGFVGGALVMHAVINKGAPP